MSNRPTEQQLRELGIEVYQIAESIFEDCGQLRDFGIQDAGGLVFGGHNRIFLRERGWVASESHCTDNFIAAFLKLPNTTVEPQGICMNNNSGKRLRNAGLVLAAIALVAAYLAVSTMGLTDTQGDLTQCQEMVSLWERTEGDYGWPNCDHL